MLQITPKTTNHASRTSDSCLMFDYVSIINFLIIISFFKMQTNNSTKFYDTDVCLSYAVGLPTYISFACHAHSFVQYQLLS